MKRNLGVIRTLMLGLTLVLSFAGQAKASGGGHGGFTGSVDGYKVALTFKAGQAQIGHNQLIVRLRDAQGQPVGNTKVTVVARKYTGAKKVTTGHDSSGMDMGKESNSGPGKSDPKEAGDHGSSSMDMGKESNSGHGPGEADQYGPPFTVALAASHDIGEYAGEAETAEAGHWMIKVMFAVPQQERSVAFMVDIKKGGPNWPVLWGFLVVNVAIISIAAMTRKKSISSPIQEEVV